MKGKRAMFLIGVVLILISSAIQWFENGGGGTRITPEDYRVKASLDYLRADGRQQEFATKGVVESAWIQDDSPGHKVNLIVSHYGHTWRVTVVFSQEALPVEYSVALAGGLRIGLQRMGIALVAVWLLAGHLLPLMFWPKCPDCPDAILNPPYLEAEERFVYPGGFDDGGDSLPAIVRRDYACPRCGYRRVTYYIPGTYRPGRIHRVAGFPHPISVKNEEFVQPILDKWWETNPKKTRFHNVEEWRTFYEELKASEHEERNGR